MPLVHEEHSYINNNKEHLTQIVLNLYPFHLLSDRIFFIEFIFIEKASNRVGSDRSSSPMYSNYLFDPIS